MKPKSTRLLAITRFLWSLLAMISLAGSIKWAVAAEQSITLAGMSVVVWSQPAAAKGKRPVIIFSHGFHGCPSQARFLMDAFAGAGYLVFAPLHRDAFCPENKGNITERPEAPFQQPQAWNESTYRGRADDIRRLIELLRTDARYGPRGDWDRLALVGHSLGGYTVLGLGGAWPGWTLPGVKAVLTLSPYSEPFLAKGSLAHISVPVMYQCGLHDLGVGPRIESPNTVYDRSPVPKYYVQFEKVGHFTWASVGLQRRKAIVAYSLAFLNHYVGGDPADALTRPLPGVARLRYASELGNSDGAPSAASGAAGGATH